MFPIIHFICSPKFCTSIVFNFSWDVQSSQEKLKTMLMHNLGGQSKCIIMGDVEVVNTGIPIWHYIVTGSKSSTAVPSLKPCKGL